MAEMIFFANTDCSKAQQHKDSLQDAGYDLRCKDILSHGWTREKLLPFVRGREPLHIMNSSAPEIKKGKIDPVLLTFEQALELMVESPTLIKGPLVKIDGLFIQGFADRRLKRYLDDPDTTN